MVGLPEMRRGSLTLVTRPSTVAPTGIKVCAVDDDRLGDLGLKGIADSVAEGGESSIEPHHQGGACGYG